MHAIEPGEVLEDRQSNIVELGSRQVRSVLLDQSGSDPFDLIGSECERETFIGGLYRDR